MSKYIIEKKNDEVIFRKITLNIEEYGEELIELTDDELDQQLKEYSSQGIYVSVYYQVQTEKHGIQFHRKRFSIDIFPDKQEYKWKPVEHDVNLEGEYYIKESLMDMEIIDTNNCVDYITENKILPQYLTEVEFVNKIRDFLNRGLEVYFVHYKYKWKKWRPIVDKVVKEVTEDGQILYR